MPAHIVATNLKALMAASAGLGTQCALAKASGIDQKTISRILNAKNSPSIDVLSSISDALGLQLWQLLVPNIDPKNLPVCELTRVEIELYKKLRRLVNTLPPANPPP